MRSVNSFGSGRPSSAHEESCLKRERKRATSGGSDSARRPPTKRPRSIRHPPAPVPPALSRSIADRGLRVVALVPTALFCWRATSAACGVGGPCADQLAQLLNRPADDNGVVPVNDADLTTQTKHLKDIGLAPMSPIEESQ